MAKQKSSKKQPKKPSKIIKTPKPNAKIENQYKKALIAQTNKMNKSLKWWAVARINKGKGNVASQMRIEFSELSEYWNSEFNEFAKKTAEKMVKQTAKENAILLKSQGFSDFTKISTNALKTALKAEINKNIALIQSIPREQILRYENTIFDNIANLDRQGVKETILQIEKKLKVADNIALRRAKTIARDQTKKACETLAQTMAQDSGFEYYVWITANDERVSGNPNGKYPNLKGGHWKLNNRIYRYDTPTAIIDSYGTCGTCGERVNCRCTSGAVYLMPNETLRLVRDSEHGDYYEIVDKQTQ